jgi:hypothetical protein
MSLYIDVDKVTQVLLADGWHVVAKQSFTLDSYEFHHKDEVILYGGQVQGVPSAGAEWLGPEGDHFACPLTAILAVRWE